MVKLKNGKLIFATVLEILETLNIEISKRGLFDYLRVIKPHSNNIQVCCPYHKNGEERRPSGGITTNDKPNTPAGTFHCFTCGKAVSLEGYVSKCLGNELNETVGIKWLLDTFSSAEGNERVLLIDDIFKQEKTEMLTYVSIDELSRYRYIHPYMYQRKLTDDIIELFDIGYDSQTKCVTFPVNDINGNCLFVARRSVNVKYFNYPRGVNKPVYGLDKIKTLIDSGEKIDTIYICESIFNALTLWSYGLYAVALLGLGDVQQYDILNNFGVRKYILAFDGDEWGWKATQRFIKVIKGKIITYLILPNGEDINSIDYDTFKTLNENF